MRSLLLLAAAAVAFAPLSSASAQARRDNDDARRQAEQEQASKKKQKDKDWATGAAPLPKVRNAGPCPYVKALYDASRYVELKDGKEAASAVGFTGEIQSVRATCEYKGDQPIRVQIAVDFMLGKGPQASGAAKDFPYWVAVTTRNESVLDKQQFAVRGDFPAGVDRVGVSDTIKQIVIPRANAQVSGANFEILVGFDVTPQMAAFNRLGKRFRVNALGQTETASAAGAPGTPKAQ